MQNQTNTNELFHYGIKGMKWGVRRFQNKDGSLTPSGKKRLRSEEKADRKAAKAAKKEVDTLHKAFDKTRLGGELASVATFSRFDAKDYPQIAELADQGKVFVKATFKKNYAERSVDVYLENDTSPTMRARMKNGEEFVAEFLDKANQIRYEEYVKYYNSRHSENK